MNRVLYYQQNFSLPSTLIYYILKNPSSYFASIKLYKSCKYFYMHQKLFFTRNFYHQYDRKYFDGSHPKDVLYWFGESLTCSESYEFFPSHRIFRCTIKEFCLSSSTITLNEFLIIVKQNTIKNFCLSRGYIKNLDGTNLSMDIVLQNLPNVEDFIFNNADITLTETQLQKIGTINLWNKFHKLYIHITYASNYFNSMPLLNFIQNNAASTFSCQIIIDGVNSQKNYENFKAASEELFKLWNGKQYKFLVYHKTVPWSVMLERLKKGATNNG